MSPPPPVVEQSNSVVPADPRSESVNRVLGCELTGVFRLEERLAVHIYLAKVARHSHTGNGVVDRAP